MSNAAAQAMLDWATLGEFKHEQFQGDDRKAYNEAAELIERQWNSEGEQA